jgi:hypothetical protein
VLFWFYLNRGKEKVAEKESRRKSGITLEFVC